MTKHRSAGDGTPRCLHGTASLFVLLLVGCGPAHIDDRELCRDPGAFQGDRVVVTFSRPIHSTVAVQSTIVYCIPAHSCCARGDYVPAVPCEGGLLAVVPADDLYEPGHSGDRPLRCIGPQPDEPGCYPDCSEHFASWSQVEGTVDRADVLWFVGPVQPTWVLLNATTVP